MVRALETRRRFFIGLTVALTGAALSASAAVDPALSALIPADATMVSGVHVAQAKNSAFGRFVLSQMESDDAGFRKFITETGFDPRRDLTELVVATVSSGEKMEPVIVGRGVFTPTRIMDLARQHGAAITNYRGVDLASHKEGAIAFVDASIAVMGNTSAVRAALDQRANSSKRLPESVTRKIAELSAANDAWFYSAASPADFLGARIADPNLGGAMKEGLLQAVTGAAGGIKFTDSNARVTGEAITRSDKDATALADVFRFLAQIVQSQGGNRAGGAQDMAELLSKMQLSTDANVMKISIAIPESLLERVFARKPVRIARR
ncbi:hypothetical protein F183_A27350 [Bryobacterales bacterium F-183]|nr:hypothetical protein F183_A27350 [Bryobacterales bacterium F-183]